MKTTYDGRILLTQSSANEVTVRNSITTEQAVTLRRNLARLTGLSGQDPWSARGCIAELVKMRRFVKIEDGKGLESAREDILDIIDAYIGLIEATNQKEDAS